MTRNSVSPTSYSNDVNSLQQCLASLFTHGFAKMGWLSTHPNQLPPSSARLSVSSLPSFIPVNIAGTVIPLSDRVKILGVTLNSNLTMDNHTKSVSIYKSCFYHIRSLRHHRSSLDDDMAGSVASAIVSSRLDYVNSILLGCPQKHSASSTGPKCPS